ASDRDLPQCGVGAAVARRPLDGARRGMDHWTVLSPDGRVLAVEEGQRRSKRGKDYVRGRSGCVEPAHRPGGEFTPHFGRGLVQRTVCQPSTNPRVTFESKVK